MSAIVHDTRNKLSRAFQHAQFDHAKSVNKAAFFAYLRGNYHAGMFILDIYDAYMMGGEL